MSATGNKVRVIIDETGQRQTALEVEDEPTGGLEFVGVQRVRISA